MNFEKETNSNRITFKNWAAGSASSNQSDRKINKNSMGRSFFPDQTDRVSYHGWISGTMYSELRARQLDKPKFVTHQEADSLKRQVKTAEKEQREREEEGNRKIREARRERFDREVEARYREADFISQHPSFRNSMRTLDTNKSQETKVQEASRFSQGDANRTIRAGGGRPSYKQCLAERNESYKSKTAGEADMFYQFWT